MGAIGIGKIGRTNQKANRSLLKEYKSRGIFHCEIGAYFKFEGMFDRCWRVRQGYAHKDNRVEYRGRLDDLGKFEETLSSCNECHRVVDLPENAELKSKLFIKLRPQTMAQKSKNLKAPARVKTKKENWMLPHKCIHCHKTLTGLLCSCGELSTK